MTSIPPYPSPEPEPPSEPGAPVAGYAVPYVPQYGYDPLISPDYAGWWQRATAIVKAGWPQLATLQGIGILVGLLLQVPLAISIAFWSRDFMDNANAGTTPTAADLSPLFAMFGFLLLAAFVEVVIAAAISIATMHLGVAIATGARRDLATAAKLALRRALPLIGWELVGGLIILVGLCLCVLPALYPVAVFSIMPAVVAFERTNAIGRCFTLFNRNFGPAAGRIATILGIGVLAGVIGSVIGQVVNAAAGVPGGFGAGVGSPDVATGTLIAATIATTVISSLIAAGVAVLTGPLTLLTYADLRARVEPLSTAVLVQEIGVSEPSASDQRER